LITFQRRHKTKNKRLILSWILVASDWVKNIHQNIAEDLKHYLANGAGEEHVLLTAWQVKKAAP